MTADAVPLSDPNDSGMPCVANVDRKLLMVASDDVSLHAGDTNSAFLFPLQDVDIAIRPRRAFKTATKETHVRGPQT